jgi:hypothetical protein
LRVGGVVGEGNEADMAVKSAEGSGSHGVCGLEASKVAREGEARGQKSGEVEGEAVQGTLITRRGKVRACRYRVDGEGANLGRMIYHSSQYGIQAGDEGIELTV